MTIREAKNLGIKKLKRASANEAAIDTEILLAHVLGISREEMLTHDERRLPAFALRRFNALLARRAKHEPVAYLTGHKEFFGLQFAVNKYTLIPRPETEFLVEEALDTLQATRNTLVIDVGTGSGAIAIAVAKNAPGVTVIATDISKQALKLAEKNAISNDVDDRIVFLRGNLLHHKMMRSHISVIPIIVANLPYLPTKVWQKCSPDVKKYEPKTALEGGKDGLKYYDVLFHQLAALVPAFSGCGDASRGRVPAGIRPRSTQTSRNASRNTGTSIICEIDPSQKSSFPKLAKRHFPKAKVEIKNDLADRARVAAISF